jgi:hypothetical protein
MEELRPEFAISQHDIDDAMKGSELLSDVWNEAGDVVESGIQDGTVRIVS